MALRKKQFYIALGESSKSTVLSTGSRTNKTLRHLRRDQRSFRWAIYGTPCVLIYDIVVRPDFRRQGLAKSLQAFAYQEMKRQGVRWVVGNINPKNTASVKQAGSLGRKPIAASVKLNS